MTEKKKSLLPDILKREKLQAFLKREDNKHASHVVRVQPPLIQPVTEPEPPTVGPGSKIFRAIEESMDDIRFYFLEGEYRGKIAALFNENETQFDRLGITPRRFLDYARESFDRFKQLQKKMPLEPMSKKAWDYMDRSLRELIGKLNERFSK
ncbi:hypothetical protein CH373_04065 [Leptospira perolatii]|uniref:Uncharacterized protein n=1 Tax=Leptospira perolatii TaxID=2023191 RepID=A0A2M9ZPV1_9LEPT|nr:hypothetical protein [Leptospira perolatii]PJZ69024.1 hypothetical protein CH360_13265 [Leptospira perolatii]PJZ74107.1 hypothetical protein CH373_04065 [Leptospira perolatii]